MFVQCCSVYPYLCFYSIILLQKCFAQCYSVCPSVILLYRCTSEIFRPMFSCSMCPSVILLHHSTSEMFCPTLQRVPISDSTPSFFFRNVSPNVAACVHPWFYSIILLQKCFAQCCSVCPSLILLHHSTCEKFHPSRSMCPSLTLLLHSTSQLPSVDTRADQGYYERGEGEISRHEFLWGCQSASAPMGKFSVGMSFYGG